MIDRLAAIAERRVRQRMVPGAYPGAPEQPGLGNTGGRGAVLAILAAIREPTEAQYEALCATGRQWRDLDSRTVWQTYIDALINERTTEEKT